MAHRRWHSDVRGAGAQHTEQEGVANRKAQHPGQTDSQHGVQQRHQHSKGQRLDAHGTQVTETARRDQTHIQQKETEETLEQVLGENIERLSAFVAGEQANEQADHQQVHRAIQQGFTEQRFPT